jgi:hypothetical protein
MPLISGIVREHRKSSLEARHPSKKDVMCPMWH